MDQFPDARHDAVRCRLHALVASQRSGQHLAKLFIDYEPGIHWSQIHMQSGITGINSVRAYSILKQSLDHDMNGDFIRKWVPELAMVPTPYIHEPWTMSDEMQATTGVVIGTTYPAPIVDETEARNQGIKATHAARRTGRGQGSLSTSVRHARKPSTKVSTARKSRAATGRKTRSQPSNNTAGFWQLIPSLT